MAHARASYLRRSLSSVLAHRPDTVSRLGASAPASPWHPLPLFVSQDGDHVGVGRVAERCRASHPDSVFHLRHPHEMLPGAGATMPPAHLRPYYYISAHYRRALAHLFDELGFGSVIVLEEDLEIAPDFFEYFLAFGPLLHVDPSLLCVSAWNDHGEAGLARDRRAVYRTDFFPGLGWMLVRRVWEELAPKWPAGFWDDWLREPAQRRGRTSLRPEVNRAVTFGRVGVSHGQFFEEHLRHMRLNDRAVPFLGLDTQWLVDSTAYEERFRRLVAAARPVSLDALAALPAGSRHDGDIDPVITNDGWPPLEPRAADLCVEYSDLDDYAVHCRALGLQSDVRSGIPRASYLGVVVFHRGPSRVFLAPRSLTRGRGGSPDRASPSTGGPCPAP